MTSTAPGCVFCAIVAGQAPATVVREWDDAVAIRPRGGVNDRHVLVLPRVHVEDAGTDPDVTAAVHRRAGELLAEHPAGNLITSKGRDATQTVFHLHVHVVPRQAGDGLPLPWTPQQEAATAALQATAASTPDRATTSSNEIPLPRLAGIRLQLVYAREPIPFSDQMVFLAGPTPVAGGDVPSWRPAAIEALAQQWAGPGPLTVLTPESRGGVRAEHYDDQVGWETDARAAADVVLYWIPRDLRALPGMTTNVEFGLDVGTGKAVLGCPPDCPNPERNRYLIYVARRHGVPVRERLPDTVAAALALIPPTTSDIPGSDGAA
jgi:diadenosine tetraphosphate (Ap4A) HIT family hydrolase